MRKTFCAVLSIAALCTAAPVMAQPQSRDRGIEREYRGDRDRDRRDGATQQELNAADARLNRIYERRIAEARAADRAAQRERRSRDWYGQEAALREAERRWIAYRDGDCRYSAQSAVGERWYRDVLRQCLVDRTEERTAVLSDGRVRLSSR